MIAAVIVAAGQGVRMGGKVRKQYLPLLGKPILCHTVQAFADYPVLDFLVLVMPEGQFDHCRRTVLSQVKFRTTQEYLLVAGGKTRQESVFNGLGALAERQGIVLVHDGVRPLISRHLIAACIQGAKRWGACIPALTVSDTLKRVAADGHITATVAREGLWMAQTPQAFQISLILAAHIEARRRGWLATDDASLVEQYGAQVKVISGSAKNIKITTADDLLLAELFLSEQTVQPPSGP